jgi:hypothetical protein
MCNHMVESSQARAAGVAVTIGAASTPTARYACVVSLGDYREDPVGDAFMVASKFYTSLRCAMGRIRRSVRGTLQFHLDMPVRSRRLVDIIADLPETAPGNRGRRLVVFATRYKLVWQSRIVASVCTGVDDVEKRTHKQSSNRRPAKQQRVDAGGPGNAVPIGVPGEGAAAEEEEENDWLGHELGGLMEDEGLSEHSADEEADDLLQDPETAEGDEAHDAPGSPGHEVETVMAEAPDQAELPLDDDEADEEHPLDGAQGVVPSDVLAACNRICSTMRVAAQDAFRLASEHTSGPIVDGGMSLVLDTLTAADDQAEAGEVAATFVKWSNADIRQGRPFKTDRLDRIVYTMPGLVPEVFYDNAQVVISRLPVAMLRSRGAGRMAMPQWVMLRKRALEQISFCGPHDPALDANASLLHREMQDCILCVVTAEAAICGLPLAGDYYVCAICLGSWHLRCATWMCRGRGPRLPPSLEDFVCPPCVGHAPADSST